MLLRQRAIEAENVLYVLKNVGAWPELALALKDIVRTAEEPEIRFKATRLLKTCATAQGAPTQKSSSKTKSLWTSLGALLHADSAQQMAAHKSEDSTELYKLRLEQIGSKIDPALDRELLKLAIFQAKIINDPGFILLQIRPHVWTSGPSSHASAHCREGD
jgi:hypothetical protein